ncbi:unnamed protein product [Allacma fusca]|uniref:Uncharacterized protein n=1 Tax=Allacma fusca TaxID=39272 RepID=A0A8J2LFH2_9HEXA|nr:unnamed protein product [Allacma fusca]
MWSCLSLHGTQEERSEQWEYKRNALYCFLYKRDFIKYCNGTVVRLFSTYFYVYVGMTERNGGKLTLCYSCVRMTAAPEIRLCIFVQLLLLRIRIFEVVCKYNNDHVGYGKDMSRGVPA